MDKEKTSQSHAQCSWMEMHQFIGDLLSSGSSTKKQPDVLNTTWGVSAAGPSAFGFKATSLEPTMRIRSAQEQERSEPCRPDQHQVSQRTDVRNKETLGLQHVCSCLGCPFSTLHASLPTRQSSSSSPHSEVTCQAKDLSVTACSPDTTAPSRSSSSTSEQQSEDDAERGTQTQQSFDAPPSKASLSHFAMFPCLCCHRGLQTCSQFLSRQKCTDSSLPHTHAHHHFHHHHCALTSCLPCTQLTPSARLSGSISCLSCQCSLSGCSQVCSSQQKQTQQQEERSQTLVPLHPCMHCSASFTRPSHLLQHQRSEHAHKSPGFLCTECGRAFNSHSNLRIHLNVHTGARPYSCSVCGKSFSQSGALKIHKRIHTGERPYSCGFCGRGFPHLAGVRAHQRIHTGEKPYRCNQCGKCFTQSGALKIHTRIHTGERPFICRLCGKGFSNRSGIRFHYRTVHGLAPEHTGETGTPGYSPGRPRTLPPASIGTNPINRANSDAHTSPNSLVSSKQIAIHHSPSVLGGKESRLQEQSAGQREELLYACEDCGLRFKDAPSRNRHQTLAHYSHEERIEEEERRGKDVGRIEGV